MMYSVRPLSNKLKMDLNMVTANQNISYLTCICCITGFSFLLCCFVSVLHAAGCHVKLNREREGERAAFVWTHQSAFLPNHSEASIMF